MRLGDRGAGQMLDGDVVCQRILALALDRLALARGEVAEKGIEIVIALIEEMELLAGALQESIGPEHLPFGFRRKRDMDRRGVDLVAPGAQAGDQRICGQFAAVA